MSEPTRVRKTWSAKGPKLGRRMTDAVITNNAYTEQIAKALRARWGDHRSAAKEIATTIKVGVGTVKKWLRGDNGPSGEHLLRLVAESDEVWAAVLELSGRREAGEEAQQLLREQLRQTLALLEGRAP